MSWRFSTAIAVLAILFPIGGAISQTTDSLARLSQYERTAATRLIDRLHSNNEQEFSNELNRFVTDFASRSLDPKPVVTALKASAGAQSEMLNRVLEAGCRSQTSLKLTYCDIAKVEAPDTSEVQTAATAAAAGGALGGALSTGTTTDSGGGGGGNAGGGDSSRVNSGPTISLRGGSGGGSFTTIGGTSTTTTTTITVPGPVAGTGLGAAFLLLGWAAIARLRKRAAPRQSAIGADVAD